MNLKEFRKLTRHLPDHMEISTSADITGGVAGICFGKRVAPGRVQHAEDGSRQIDSNMVIVVSTYDAEDWAKEGG